MLKKEEDRLKRELTLKRLRKATADMVPSLLPACVPGLCSPGHAPARAGVCCLRRSVPGPTIIWDQEATGDSVYNRQYEQHWLPQILEVRCKLGVPLPNIRGRF